MNAIDLACFGHFFSSIAEEMGVSLQRTGFSPNIKERRDYSCAIFDAHGDMIAQAAHIPVHLGAMPLSTKAAIRALPMAPGDAVILNDPFQGGTHLPDITLVSPVYFEGDTTPRFYVANRAHHADIGGITPGSMPLSTHIDEEGVLIPPRYLLRGGVLQQDFLQEFLSQVRTPHEREGDLAAQRAANHVGIVRLQELATKHGATTLEEAASALCDYAARMTMAAICEIPRGRYRDTDWLEDDGMGTDDIAICVEIAAEGDGTLTIDFTGSAAAVAGCVNAVEAITVSACHYVFRCLVDVEIPANSGVSRPLRIILPRDSVVNASAPSAVAGGNVETSQRIVDVLFRALAQALPEKIPAASCGSMNNLSFGGVDTEGRAFAYYETIAGGAGAGPSWHGASAVHTHMTNTQNTPVEALEHSYPLRVEAYHVRHGSGGQGHFVGGDGVTKTLHFLAPTTATLLTERRRLMPWGLAGGKSGQAGENAVIRGTQRETLPSKAVVSLHIGDRLEIQTPGGGGFGLLQALPSQ